MARPRRAFWVCIAIAPADSHFPSRFMNPEITSPALDLYATIVLYASLICLAHMVFTKGRGVCGKKTWELGHWGVGRWISA